MFGIETTKEDVKNTTIDVGRGLTLAIVVHVLSVFIDDKGELLNEQFLKQMLYITIAMVLYNLVIRKKLLEKIIGE
jgi:hypothetical protein